jgi:hypothetical protein
MFNIRATSYVKYRLMHHFFADMLFTSNMMLDIIFLFVLHCINYTCWEKKHVHFYNAQQMDDVKHLPERRVWW